VTVQLSTEVETLTTFPAVTFCNLNPFDFTTVNNTGVYINNAIMSGQLNPYVTVNGSNDTAAERVYDILSYLKSYIIADKNKSEEDRHLMGFSLETMLVSCFFNGIKCGPEDFDMIWSYEYGNCYTFNSNFKNTNKNLIKTSKFGMNSGLVMELFTGVPGFNNSSSSMTNLAKNENFQVCLRYRRIDPSLDRFFF
jgi:hypothetical protein